MLTSLFMRDRPRRIYIIYVLRISLHDAEHNKNQRRYYIRRYNHTQNILLFDTRYFSIENDHPVAGDDEKTNIACDIV